MAKSIKVHDETHRALKMLKANRRSRSFDEVIRDMVRQTTGTRVEEMKTGQADELTKYLND